MSGRHDSGPTEAARTGGGDPLGTASTGDRRLRRDTVITAVAQLLALGSGIGLSVVAARSMSITEFAVGAPGPPG